MPKKQQANDGPAKISSKTSSPGWQARHRLIRKGISEKAFELFKSAGYEQTTIAQINAAVGISQRTFFRYFQSKDDLIFDVIDAAVTAFLEPSLRVKSEQEESTTTLKRALIDLAKHDDEDSVRIRWIASMLLESPSLSGRYQQEYAKWQEIAARALADKRKKPEESFALRVQIASVFAAFVTAAQHWLKDPKKRPLADWCEQAFRALS